MAELVVDGFNILCVEPEGSWIYDKIPAILTVDKSEILADGLDTATVVASVDPGVDVITFSNFETGDVIATIPVDQQTNTAELQVSMESEGNITILAGELKPLKKNIVTITAKGSGAI